MSHLCLIPQNLLRVAWIQQSPAFVLLSRWNWGKESGRVASDKNASRERYRYSSGQFSWCCLSNTRLCCSYIDVFVCVWGAGWGGERKFQRTKGKNAFLQSRITNWCQQLVTTFLKTFYSICKTQIFSCYSRVISFCLTKRHYISNLKSYYENKGY